MGPSSKGLVFNYFKTEVVLDLSRDGAGSVDPGICDLLQKNRFRRLAFSFGLCTMVSPSQSGGMVSFKLVDEIFFNKSNFFLGDILGSDIIDFRLIKYLYLADLHLRE